MEGDPMAVFQAWLHRRAGQQVDADEIDADAGTLDHYVAEHGLPQRIVSEPEIRVAAYKERFVGEVRGTGSVLVFTAPLDN